MKIAENVVLIVGIVFWGIVVKTISEEARSRALKSNLYEECVKDYSKPKNKLTNKKVKKAIKKKKK